MIITRLTRHMVYVACAASSRCSEVVKRPSVTILMMNASAWDGNVDKLLLGRVGKFRGEVLSIPSMIRSRATLHVSSLCYE